MKAAEGRDEIHKDAIFLLEFCKFFKEVGTTTDFNHCLVQFKSSSQASKKNLKEKIEKVKKETV